MPYINIEISGLCNAKCPYCAHTRRLHEGYRGTFMSAAMFQSIIDKLIRKKVINDHYRETDAIDLFNWGEPFLHPDINSILKIVQDHKLLVNICTFTEPKSPCTACTESGLSWYLAHPITSYPSGGGTYGIRARAKHSFIISKNSMLTSIGHTLRRTYVGTKLVHLVKR